MVKNDAIIGRILDNAEVGPGMDVLDVACGTGVMFDYYVNHPEALPDDFHPQMSFEGMERTVCDYIAGMTDHYAVDKYTEIFIPAGWNVRG
jgi:ubiquinone/menaquinone biosynthesis C-methylase UbiE